VTCLPKLLTASAVIAASLLGGCTDGAIGTGGADARAPAAVAAKPVAQPQAVDRPVGERLASAALDDGRLSQIRGGMEAGPGVVLNFAFQQATFVNHNLAETVVVPTLTVTPNQVTTASSLAGLGIAPSSIAAAIPNVNSATVVANGVVQTQVSVSAPVLQALVNTGMASVVGGGGGIGSTLINAQNNALVQQITTLDIGVTGLSKLLQQSIPSSVASRLSGANGFR
jgi:hypothetical protein